MRASKTLCTFSSLDSKNIVSIFSEKCFFIISLLDLLDRIRYFAEECDNLQCVRVFADLHDGFAGTCAFDCTH